jgi:hypothetical protein
MNEISSHQATLIHDIASYKEVMGAKRFKRTKEEMAMGLTAEKALELRLREANDLPAGAVGSRPTPRASTSRKGDITIKIRPAAGVESSYFERLPNGPVEIVLDEKWYGWFGTLLDSPYDGDNTKLLNHILDLGIGEALTRFHFPKDIEDYES